MCVCRKAWGESTDVGTEEELWGSADSASSSPKTVREDRGGEEEGGEGES